MGSLFGHAQYQWTEAYVILKNGKTLSGQAKLTDKSTAFTFTERLKFRKDKDSKTTNYKTEDIEEVMFTVYKHEFANDAVYRSNTTLFFVPVPTHKMGKKTKYNLMQEIQSGDVSLYSRNFIITKPSIQVSNTSDAYGTMQYIAPSAMTTTEHIELWLVKTNEKAVLIRSSGIFNNLRKQLLKYFADCPEITEAIEDSDLNHDDIEDIVNNYNLECGF